MIDTKQTLKPQTKVEKMAGTEIDAARAETLKIISGNIGVVMPNHNMLDISF